MTTETIEVVKQDKKINKNTEEPGKYNVIFLNDDYTPMEFVVELLMVIFKHNLETAKNIMLQVHEKGKGVAGTYTFEIAEQKTSEASHCAKQQGYPLAIQIDKV